MGVHSSSVNRYPFRCGRRGLSPGVAKWPLSPYRMKMGENRRDGIAQRLCHVARGRTHRGTRTSKSEHHTDFRRY